MALKPILRGRLAASCVPLIATVACSATAAAAEQKGKAFSVKKLKVKVGDSVKFVNDDPFSHNVLSL